MASDRATALVNYDQVRKHHPWRACRYPSASRAAAAAAADSAADSSAYATRRPNAPLLHAAALAVAALAVALAAAALTAAAAAALPWLPYNLENPALLVGLVHRLARHRLARMLCRLSRYVPEG